MGGFNKSYMHFLSLLKSGLTWIWPSWMKCKQQIDTIHFLCLPVDRVCRLDHTVGHPPAHNNTGSGLTLYQFQDFLFSLSLSLFKLIKHQSETDFQNILSQCKFNSLCVSPYSTPVAKLSRSLLQPFAGKLQVEYLKDAWDLRQRYQLLKTPTKGNLKVFLGLNVQHWK